MRRLPAVLLPLLVLAGSGASEVVERVPRSGESSVVVPGGPAADWGYLAFPALLDLGDELLVSFKRARAHAQDPGAALDLVRLDPATGAIRPSPHVATVPSPVCMVFLPPAAGR